MSAKELLQRSATVKIKWSMRSIMPGAAESRHDNASFVERVAPLPADLTGIYEIRPCDPGEMKRTHVDEKRS